MKKCYKGQAGYFKYRKIKLGLITLTGFLLVLGIYLTGYLIYGTGKNYVTILSVVAVLPTAKFLVQYLMFPWKGFVDMEEYEALKVKCEPLNLYSELLITASEKRFQITYLLIDKDDNIAAYTPDEKADTDAFEKGVTNFLNYYDFNSKVKLYKDIKTYEKRCSQLAAKNKELTDGQHEHIETVFEKISIMSI
ncbi:MAG: hypothetical protein ACI4EN_02530 [Butyrivibrio sp.]